MLQAWRETCLEQVAMMTGGVDDAVVLKACDGGSKSPGQSAGGN